MMDPTIEALQASIKNHERNLQAQHPAQIQLGGQHCPLCELVWISPIEGTDCTQCPVMHETGQRECEGTPYTDLVHLYRTWFLSPDDPANRDAFRKAEQAEVDFLKSLLPEGGE